MLAPWGLRCQSVCSSAWNHSTPGSDRRADYEPIALQLLQLVTSASWMRGDLVMMLEVESVLTDVFYATAIG